MKKKNRRVFKKKMKEETRREIESEAETHPSKDRDFYCKERGSLAYCD